MAGKVSSDPNVFILPDLGEGLEEAELIKWTVSEGDTVEEHQIMAEMETDKALVEVPSPRAGTIATLHGDAGDIIKVGAAFVTYKDDGSGAGSPSGSPHEETSASTSDATEAADEDDGTVVGQMSDAVAGMNRAEGEALATPAVRRLARDLGVDIDGVPGTGIGGRVMARDVEAAAKGGTAKGGAAKPGGAKASGTSAGSKPAPTGSSSEGSASTSSQAATGRPAASAPMQSPPPSYGQPQYGQAGYGQAGYGQGGMMPQQQGMMQPGMQQPMGGQMPMGMMMPWGMPPMMMMVPMMMPGMGMPGMGGMMPQQPAVPALPGYQPSQQRPIPDPAQKSGVEPGAESASVPFRGVRRTIANRLRESIDTAVHFTVMDEADVTALDDLRRRLAAETGVKLSFLPFVSVAVCRALTSRFGALNATVNDKGEEVVQHGPVHLGIATDTDSGLMVPVIRGADSLGVVQMQQQIGHVAASARDRSAPREMLSGSTFTISNVGSHAGKFATPVINYPEVGILATGRVYDAVVVRDGQPAVGKMMPLSLACDHRVVDGATAALALAEIVRSMEDPQSLLG